MRLLPSVTPAVGSLPFVRYRSRTKKMADDDLFAEAFARVATLENVDRSLPHVRSESVSAQTRPVVAIRAPVHPAFRPRQNPAKTSQGHPQSSNIAALPQNPALQSNRAGIPSNSFYASMVPGNRQLSNDGIEVTKQTMNPVFARAYAGDKWNCNQQHHHRKPMRKTNSEINRAEKGSMIQPPNKVSRGKHAPQSSAVVAGQCDDNMSKFRFGTVTHQNVPECYPDFDVEAGNTWIYPINFPRRQYQFTICEHALFYNTMVSLPTGLGKTFIAAVIMFNFYRWYPKRKILFAAPTRPLVAQQMRACYEVMGVPQYHMAELTGAMSPTDRMAVWRDKRMLFLTPQVIKNDLTLMSIKPEEIICIVFDEAHAAHGNHAYCNIIREMIVRTTQFRILALSATPGKNRDSIQEVIKNLLISRVDIRVNESIDIRPYTHARRITVDIIKYDPQTQDFIDRFQAVMNNYIKRLKGFGAIPDHIPNYKISPFLVLTFHRQFQSAPTRQLNKTLLQLCHSDFSLLHSLTRAGESLRFYGLRSFWRNMVQFLDGQKGNPRVKSEIVMNPAVVKLQADVCRALNIDDENVSKVSQLQNDVIKRQTHAAYQRTLLEVSLGRHGPSTQAAAIDLMPSASQEQRLMSAMSPAVDNFVYGHPKMQRLEEIVLEHFRSRDSEFRYQMNGGNVDSSAKKAHVVDKTTRCIVFVQFRDSCAEITQMLERHEPLIRASMFVGQSSRGAGSKKQQNLDGEDEFMDEEERRAKFLKNKYSGRVGQKQREQLAVIDKFRSGELNALVATCVGEEGLDVGEVDLIVCYDMQKSPVRMVQRMGRTGRKREGRVVVLLTEGLEEERYSKANQTKDDAADQLARTADFMYYHDCPRLVPRDIKPRIEEVMLKQRAFVEKPVKQLKNKLHKNDSDDESGKKPRKTARLDDWLRTGVLNSDTKKRKKSKNRTKVDFDGMASTAVVHSVEDDGALRLTEAQLHEYQLKYQCDLPNDVKLLPRRTKFGVRNIPLANYPELNSKADGGSSNDVSNGSGSSIEVVDDYGVTYEPVPMMPVGVATQDTRQLRLTAFGSAYQSVPTPTFALRHSDACGTLIRANKLFEHFRRYDEDDVEVELFENGSFAAIEAAHDDVRFDVQPSKESYFQRRSYSEGFAAAMDADEKNDRDVLDAGDICEEDFAAVENSNPPPTSSSFPAYASMNYSQNFLSRTITGEAAAEFDAGNLPIVDLVGLPGYAQVSDAVQETSAVEMDMLVAEEVLTDADASAVFADNSASSAVNTDHNTLKADETYDDFLDDLAGLDIDALDTATAHARKKQMLHQRSGSKLANAENTSLNSALKFLQPTQQPRLGAFSTLADHEKATYAERVRIVLPPVVSANSSLRCDEIVGISNCHDENEITINDSFFDAAFNDVKPKSDAVAAPRMPIQQVPAPPAALIYASARKSINFIGLPRHSSTPRHPALAAVMNSGVDLVARSSAGPRAGNLMMSPIDAFDVLSPIRSLSMLQGDNTEQQPDGSNAAVDADDDSWLNEKELDDILEQDQQQAFRCQTAMGSAAAAASSSIHCRQKLDFDGNQSDQVDSFSMLHEINNKEYSYRHDKSVRLPENLQPNGAFASHQQNVPSSSSSTFLANKVRGAPLLNSINHTNLLPHQPSTVLSSSKPSTLNGNHTFRSPFLSPLRVGSGGARSTASLLSAGTSSISSGKRLGLTRGLHGSKVTHQHHQQNLRDYANDGFMPPLVAPRATTHNYNNKPSPKSSDEKVFKNWRCRPAAGQPALSTSNHVVSDDSPVGKYKPGQRPARRQRPKTKSAFFSDDEGSPTEAATAQAAADNSIEIVEEGAAQPGAQRRGMQRQASMPVLRPNVNEAANQRRRRPRRQRNEFIATQAEVSDDDEMASADEDDIHYDDAALQREEYDAEMSSFINHNEPTQTGIDVRTLYARQMRERDEVLSADGFMAQLRARARRNEQQYTHQDRRRIEQLGYDPNIYSQAPDDSLDDTYDEGDGFVVKD